MHCCPRRPNRPVLERRAAAGAAYDPAIRGVGLLADTIRPVPGPAADERALWTDIRRPAPSARQPRLPIAFGPVGGLRILVRLPPEPVADVRPSCSDAWADGLNAMTTLDRSGGRSCPGSARSWTARPTSGEFTVTRRHRRVAPVNVPMRAHVEVYDSDGGRSGPGRTQLSGRPGFLDGQPHEPGSGTDLMDQAARTNVP
jgi:hypothetical protein